MKKKITFFIYNMYASGGTERVVSMIANELSKNKKYDVEIVSLYKTNDKTFYEILPGVKLKNIITNELKPMKLHYFDISKNIKYYFKEYETDFFVCVSVLLVSLTNFMNKKTRYIVWEHFNAYEGRFGGLDWIGRKMVASSNYEMIVLTKKDIELQKRRFGNSGKNIHQIYNPILLNDNKASDYRVESKKIITAGRFTKQKGFDMLVEVARKVFDKHSDWQWDIYGKSSDDPSIEEKIKEYKLEKNLIIKGEVNNLYDLYKEYSFYVMTSRYEGFAMVNIEAHYAKLPIISFNCNCGPDEIIQEGVNGYLIDCFDIEEMANKINYLVEHPEVREIMSRNTVLDKEKLQLENIIKEWEKIIER